LYEVFISPIWIVYKDKDVQKKKKKKRKKKKKKKNIDLGIKFEKWFPEIINYENLSNIDSKIYISFIDIEKFESAATGSIFIIPSEFKKKKKKKKNSPKFSFTYWRHR